MVRPNKRLGQHFLRDKSVVEKTILALELDGWERVLEIGPGEGVLTEALAAHAGEVVAVELDRGLVAGLRYAMPDNVEVVHGDALQVDLEGLGPFDRIAGNLPYQISSPLTFRIFDLSFQRAVFLYQFEFAERLAAVVGDPSYGRLSVTRAYRARAQMLRKVKPGAFHPVPKVMSGLIALIPHDTEPFPVGDVGFFDALVRELFTQRRKTLRKALANQAPVLGLGQIDTTTAARWLDEAGADAERVEGLSPEGYGRLAMRLLVERAGGGPEAPHGT